MKEISNYQPGFVLCSSCRFLCDDVKIYEDGEDNYYCDNCAESMEMMDNG